MKTLEVIIDCGDKYCGGCKYKIKKPINVDVFCNTFINTCTLWGNYLHLRNDYYVRCQDCLDCEVDSDS